MSGSSENSYNEMWDAIISVADEQSYDIPEKITIHLDFEIASSNSVTSHFHEVRVVRCLFHLAQNVFKRVQNSGLQESYNTNPTIKRKVRSLTVLAVLKIEDVLPTFIEMYNSCQDFPELIPIFDYFGNNYVNGSLRNTNRSLVERRNKPLFPISEWNCFDCLNEDMDTTNNFLEGWHLRIKTLCGRQHPDIWAFIQILYGEFNKIDIDIDQYITGGFQNKKKKEDRERECNRKRLFALYKSGEIAIPDYIFGMQSNSHGDAIL